MSQSPSGYVRQDMEKYYTPEWPVAALCSKESFLSYTVDPAAGAWHIVNALKSYGIEADGFDIDPEPPSFPRNDFLAWRTFASVNIITNPPYGKGGRLAVRFIEHALSVTEEYRGKVAMLLRVDFDSANGRRHIFGDHPAFDAKYILTKRIRWANLPQSAAGPTENHAWFVWDWTKQDYEPNRPATLGYLP